MRLVSMLTAFLMIAACQAQPGLSEPSGPGGTAEPGARGEMCGGPAGAGCGEGLYCAAPAGQCVDTADGAGTCAPRPEMCTQQYDPVCGCDGKTYGNACTAASAGVNIVSEGECPAN